MTARPIVAPPAGHRGWIRPLFFGVIAIVLVAAIGILINGITAWLFVSGSKSDLNIRGAYLHMVSDAAVSASVRRAWSFKTVMPL